MPPLAFATFPPTGFIAMAPPQARSAKHRAIENIRGVIGAILNKRRRTGEGASVTLVTRRASDCHTRIAAFCASSGARPLRTEKGRTGGAAAVTAKIEVASLVRTYNRSKRHVDTCWGAREVPRPARAP